MSGVRTHNRCSASCVGGRRTLGAAVQRLSPFSLGTAPPKHKARKVGPKRTSIRAMAAIATPLGRLGLRTAIAFISLATVFAQAPSNVPASAGVYAAVGEELIAFALDVERAML